MGALHRFGERFGQERPIVRTWIHGMDSVATVARIQTAPFTFHVGFCDSPIGITGEEAVRMGFVPALAHPFIRVVVSNHVNSIPQLTHFVKSPREIFSRSPVFSEQANRCSVLETKEVRPIRTHPLRVLSVPVLS